MLTWIDKQPHFYLNNYFYNKRMGNCLVLGFGHEYVDDVCIEAERFLLYLKKREVGWQVELDETRSRGWINKDMVDNLIHEINNALIKKEDYDISDYVLRHKNDEAYFSFGVRQEKT